MRISRFDQSTLISTLISLFETFFLFKKKIKTGEALYAFFHIPFPLAQR